MNTKSIIRGAAWTTWTASVIFSKGLTAPVAPYIEGLVDSASDLLGGMIGNWVAEDLRADDLDPGNLGANGHLEHLVALAIQGVVHNLPKHDFSLKSHAATAEALGKALRMAWPEIARIQHTTEAGDDSLDGWLAEELTKLGSDKLHSLVFGQLNSPAGTTSLDPLVWHHILGRVWDDRKEPLDPALKNGCAEALHRHLALYLYEVTKLSAEKFPAAYAGIHLRILEEQTAILDALYHCSAELTPWLGDRFGEITTNFASIIRQFSDLTSAQLSIASTLEGMQAEIHALSTSYQETAAKLDRLITDFAPEVRDRLERIAADTAFLPGVKEDTSAIRSFLHEELPGMLANSTAGMKILKPRRLPQAARKLFGREREIEEIVSLFREHKRFALTGPGGLGKTALASAVIHAFEASPGGKEETAGGIYYHDFYRSPSLGDFVTGILQQAGILCDRPQLQPAYAAMALRQPGVLLYIEGGEKLATMDDLLEFLDDSTRLFLTTRDPRQAESMESFSIGPIAEDTAAQAIHWHAANHKRSRNRKWTHGPELEGWKELARDLGGHPLACVIAGDHCGVHAMSPGQLHETLASKGMRHLAKGEDSKHNLHILFRQSAESVAALSPGDPSPALFAWLLLTLGGTNPTPLSVLNFMGLADERDLEPLLDLELVVASSVPAEMDGEEEPGYELAHALLGEWGRMELGAFGFPSEILLKSAKTWGMDLNERMLAALRIPGGDPRYRLIAPLAETLLGELAKVPEFPDELSYLFYQLVGRMHELHAMFLPAELAYRNGLQVVGVLEGDDISVTATAFSNLGSLLQATNRMAEAESLMRRALEIDQRSLGSDHPRVAILLSNLAQLLQTTNRMAEAEPLMRRALEIDERNFGPDHLKVASHLNNLASLLQDTNRIAEAEPLMWRALEIDQRSFGLQHPKIAIRLNNLASLLQDTNRMAEAEPLMRQALEIDERNFGPDHPKVALDLNNLARLFQDTNRIAEAEPLMRRALEIDERRFGPDHPTVAIRLNNLASLLQDTNRIAEAEPLMRRALKIDEQSMGPHHPKVALDLNNLASLLQATNRIAEAEPLMRRALEIDQRSFGSDHPKVAGRLNNLALLLKRTSRIAEAEPLMRRALEIDERNFGPHHPRVASHLNNLASLLQATNRMAEAEPLMRRVIQIMESSLGAGHPNFAMVLNNLATLLMDSNRLDEAEPLMRQQLQIFLKFTTVTKQQHPHLIDSFKNYWALCAALQIPDGNFLKRLFEMGRQAGLLEEQMELLISEAFPSPEGQ